MGVIILREAVIGGNTTVRAINSYSCVEYLHFADLAKLEFIEKAVRGVETVVFYDCETDKFIHIWSRQPGFADELHLRVQQVAAYKDSCSFTLSYIKPINRFSWVNYYQEYYRLNSRLCCP